MAPPEYKPKLKNQAMKYTVIGGTLALAAVSLPVIVPLVAYDKAKKKLTGTKDSESEI
jgi:hypothetical protein